MKNAQSNVFDLPNGFMDVLEAEAQYAELSVEEVVKQAIRLYQKVAIRQRQGLSVAFVDNDGQIVTEQNMLTGMPDWMAEELRNEKLKKSTS